MPPDSTASQSPHPSPGVQLRGGKLVGVVTHGESKDDGKLALSPTLGDMQSFIARNKKIFPAGGKPLASGFADWGKQGTADADFAKAKEFEAKK